MRKFKIETLPAALLVFLWAFLNRGILFSGETFVFMDASPIFYPLWLWGAKTLGAGYLPLWNPDMGLGAPFLSDPQTLGWYPVKLLLYSFLDPTTAFTALLSGHSLWGLTGFWVFARGRGAGPWIALLGCLIFGFSFNAVALHWSTSMPLVFAWVPWVFWAGDRLWNGEGKFLLVFSVVLAMQMAAGYPLFVLMTLLMWVAGLLVERGGRMAGDWKSGKLLPAIFRTAGAGVLAFFFNAAWILPLWEFIAPSNLQKRLELGSSVPWRALLTWLDPFYLGHPLLSSTTPFIFSVYFAGLPVVALVVWGVAFKKVRWPLAALWVFVLVLSLGETAGPGGWLRAILPGYHWIVRSGYWIPFVMFGTARLAMEAAQSLADEPKRGGGVRSWWLVVLAVYLAALALTVPWTLATFWVSFGFSILAGGAAWANRRGAPIFLCLALIFSLGPVLRSIHFLMNKSYYREIPSWAQKMTPPGRVYHSPDLVEAYRYTSGKGVSDAYQNLREVLPPNWPLVLGLEETALANTIFLKTFLRWYYAPLEPGGGYSKKILDYLGSRYVLGLPPGPGSKVIESSRSWTAWSNAGAFPKWFSVLKAVPQGDWERDLTRMKSPLFPLNRLCFDAGLSEKATFSPRKVLETGRTPNQIVLRAPGRGKALLVSSETAYPGWRAFAGSREVPLRSVNHGFRGVVLEDGQEEVRLVYTPVTFRLGCFWSLLACGFWAFGLLSWWRDAARMNNTKTKKFRRTHA